MREIAFLNGKFVDLHETKASVLAPDVLYGWGLFETLRSFNGRIVYLREHLQRISQASRTIGIRFPCPQKKLAGIIIRTARMNGFNDSYVRLNLYKANNGTCTIVTAKNYFPYTDKKYQQGFKACISALRQDEKSVLTRLKTTNRLFYQLAGEEARKKGCAEALILNSRGFIAEGSRTNIFLVKNKKIFTPSLDSGCLGGITRKAVLDLAGKHGLKAEEKRLPLKHLREADEAFLTNSLVGIMPLVSLEKKLIGKGKPGSITLLLMHEYSRLLKG